MHNVWKKVNRLTNSLLLAKLGTQPEIREVVDQIARLLPGTQLLGIQSSFAPLPESVIPIAREETLLLGAFDDWWAQQLYVDPMLYVKLLPRESQLLRMAERVAIHDLYELEHPRFPAEKFTDDFDGRMQLLLRHIAFWDWVIKSKHVEAVVGQNLPHNFWDAVLYEVAVARGIPYLCFHEVRPFLNCLYIYESPNEMGNLTFGRELISRTSQRYGWIEESKPRKSLMRHQVSPDNAVANREAGTQKDFTFYSRLQRLLTKPRFIPQKLYRFVRRRIGSSYAQRSKPRLVDCREIQQPFFLMELQAQSNATTLLKGYMYGDPREMIAHVADCLPEGTSLVICESSREKSRRRPRRKQFWTQVASLPSVHIADTAPDMNSLLERSSGLIELGYSSIALAAINKGVPVVLLGLTHLPKLPNTYHVKTKEQLREALLDSISNSGGRVQSESIGEALEEWVESTRAATIEGTLSSFPRVAETEQQYVARVVNNVAHLVATWFEMRVPQSRS